MVLIFILQDEAHLELKQPLPMISYLSGGRLKIIYSFFLKPRW